MPDFAEVLTRALPGARLLSVQPLTGGVSAQVNVLDVLLNGQPGRLVLREYGQANLARDPDAARTEARLLAHLHAADLPVPEPVWHERGRLLTTFLNGENGTVVAVDAAPLARFLARLHTLPTAGLPLAAGPTLPVPTEPPDDSLSETRIRTTLGRSPLAPTSSPVLLHGDLWPGNTLWHGGQLSGVIDWEDACLGDPLSDVGNTRLELLFFAGWEAMHAFTSEYLRLTSLDASSLPVWDLRAALRPCGRMHTWGLEAALERQMRERHAAFVQNACSNLEHLPKRASLVGRANASEFE